MLATRFKMLLVVMALLGSVVTVAFGSYSNNNQFLEAVNSTVIMTQSGAMEFPMIVQISLVTTMLQTKPGQPSELQIMLVTKSL